MRPIIALAMGDPAGISPELTARLLALDEIVAEARIVVIGDRRVLDDGARVAGVTLDLISASTGEMRLRPCRRSRSRAPAAPALPPCGLT